ncbi:hypothetical protein [Streptomyces sp. NPDC002851]
MSRVPRVPRVCRVPRVPRETQRSPKVALVVDDIVSFDLAP